MLLGTALDRLCPPQHTATQAVDVRLGRRRSLSPDVLVVTAKATARNVSHYLPTEVAFVVEIVSPGSLTMDRITKPALYAQAGLPCYWRIETEGRLLVAAYRLDASAGVYTPAGEFTDVINVDEPFSLALPLAAFADK